MTESAEAILAALPARLHDLPLKWAREVPDLPALTEGETTWSWSRFGAEIDAAGDALKALGVRPGDRVMFVHENGLAAGTLLFAASRIDAIAVPVNARLAADEIDHIREHCRPARVLFTTAVSKDAGAHAERQGVSPFAWDAAGEVMVSEALEADPEPVTGDPARDIAVLLYTTGTTGRSKGVMLSHRSVIYVSAGPGSPAPLTHDDCCYAALPISHAYGLCSTFIRAIYAGAQAILQPRFSAEIMLQALADGVTVCNGVPAMYARLLEHIELTGAAVSAPRLRALTAGGAPVDPDLAARVQDVFGMGIVNGYGLTEAGPTVSRSAPGDYDTSGPPLVGVDVRVVDKGGADLPQGETGELWVRGPNLMLGYYRDPEATAQVVTSDGWLKTGDLGRVGPDGRITLVDRAKEIIIRSGFNVSPIEVEEALNTHPKVVQAAVVGVSLAGNEEVIAFIEALPGQTPTVADLAAWAKERLAPYKRPSHIEIVDVLPAAPTGKVLKASSRNAPRRCSQRPAEAAAGVGPGASELPIGFPAARRLRDRIDRRNLRRAGARTRAPASQPDWHHPWRRGLDDDRCGDGLCRVLF